MASITQSCTKCHKQFHIIDQERAFLAEKNLPNPLQCPSCRQLRRLSLRGTRQLFKTTCQKCSKEIIVSFDPKTATNPIYCRKDYDQYFADNDPIITDPLPEF